MPCQDEEIDICAKCRFYKHYNCTLGFDISEIIYYMKGIYNG